MIWKFRNKYRTYLETGVMSMPDGTATFTRGRNIYVSLAGDFRRLPFDAGRDGIWRFDGQFYYLIKEQ